MKKFILMLCLLFTCCSFTYKTQAVEGEQVPPTTPQVEEVVPTPLPQTEQVEEPFDFGKWLEETIKPETIIAFLTAPATITAILTLLSLLKKAKRKAELTAEDVQENLKDFIEKANKESVEKMFNDLMLPLQAKIDKNNEIFNGFAKVLTLQQENTPESKIACLKVLQEMGNVEEKVVEQAKIEVEKQIEEKAKVETEKKETLDSIVKSNEGRC